VVSRTSPHANTWINQSDIPFHLRHIETASALLSRGYYARKLNAVTLTLLYDFILSSSRCPYFTFATRFIVFGDMTSPSCNWSSRVDKEINPSSKAATPKYLRYSLSSTYLHSPNSEGQIFTSSCLQ